MDLARVIGCVVSTEKHKSLVGSKLCVIQPINENGEDVGAPIIAVDIKSQVGSGETVYYVASGDAALLEEGKPMPVDAAVVGIVDTYETDPSLLKSVGSLRCYRKYRSNKTESS
ncbi:MAG TPA: EutN/CcmL family microcompartment protein [bacterium]|nr:EutN/CcmL family microcompartment protein [bacterium]